MICEGVTETDDLLPDSLWARIEPHLPRYRSSRRGGRPRVVARRVMSGILYVMRTGCAWQSVPPALGSGATLHRYYRDWVRRGVFTGLRRSGLKLS